MRIMRYECKDSEKTGWHFQEIELGRINLFVGESATGKTRLLNTIFNLGRFASSREFKSATWKITFEHDNTIYSWLLETSTVNEDETKGYVVNEKLKKHGQNGNEDIHIIERTQNFHRFMGKDLPKLSPTETSVSLLQEEELVKPIHKAFSQIMRRRFFHDDLAKISELHTVPLRLRRRFETNKDVADLFYANMHLSTTLSVLEKYFSNLFRDLCERFKSIFPFIEEIRIVNLSQIQSNISTFEEVPIFTIREKNSDKWIPINELSSGMQKVLLILTDTVVMPSGSVYIIDEYENSLGINAINFFPDYVLEIEKEIQFLVTSHHPYLINALPIQNWYIFHRDGTKVSIKYGEELKERFSRSRQQAFIQLINDPFYSKGVK